MADVKATIVKGGKYFDNNIIDPDFIKANEHLESHGPRHVPVSHALILEAFRNKCEQMGLMLFNEQGALSKCGERYMYVAEVMPECADNGKDYHLAVGFRSFNDESSVFQMSCGARVMNIDCAGICQTSVIIPSKRKHTKTIHELLDTKIESGLETFKQDAVITEENLKIIKETPYSDELLGKMIIALGRSKRLGNTNIMKILEECDNIKDDTAWRILTACLNVTGKRIANPLQSLDTSKLMHDELMKAIKPEYVPLGEILDEAA